MKYPKLRELKEAVTSLVTPAYTSKFPFKPHTPEPSYRGKPVVNDDFCVGCETCANVCPSGAITVEDLADDGIRIIRRDFGKCIFCGQCEEHCITKEGVKLSDKIYELATFDRHTLVETQEKELLTCRNCGAIITTKKHFEFMHHKLGPKAYASLMNLNTLNERLELAGEQDVEVEVIDDLKRKDMFNVLCPNCLRQVLVKNLK